MIPNISPSGIPPAAPEPKKRKDSSKELFSLPLKAMEGQKNPEAFQKTIFHALTKGLTLKSETFSELTPIFIGAFTMALSKKNAETDRSLSEFAKQITESLKKDFKSELEPFEAYAERVRNQIFFNTEKFSEKISAGFRVLMQEIEKKPDK